VTRAFVSAYDRRVTAHRFGQHAVVGGELHAAKRDAVEDLPGRACIADSELRAELGDVALRIGRDVVELRLLTRARRYRRLMADVPRANVQAGAQPEIALARTDTRPCGVVRVRAVTDETAVDALLPLFG
jgi:hypothetical protein